MVASIIGSGISALGNIVGGLASNSLSTYQQMQLAKYQAKLNYKYAKKSALNSPSWNRQGLETAGYNPMLALSNIGSVDSGWTSTSGGQSPDFSNVGSNAVDTLNALQQQKNQNDLTESQVQNYNADSVLKNNQAVTELYSQLEKLNHADLMQAQKILTDKDVSWYDKKQAREDLRVANEIERTGNDFKVGMAQAIASQISANANMQASISNAKDVKSRLPINKQEEKIRKWNAKHPVLSRLLPGTASSSISAGATLLK